MRYLSLAEVILLHQLIMDATGGATDIRDLGALQFAVAQPRAAFGGRYLYETATQKVAALGFSLALNHPFMDGNKRVAHAAMEAFLALNGFDLHASIDEQERVMLLLANGKVSRERLNAWLEVHVHPHGV